jgi:ribokinase
MKGPHPRVGRVTVIGSMNMDLVARAPRLPRVGETLTGRGFALNPGGKGANQAVAAARLGAQVAMIGRVGSDANGDALVRALQAEGIDCSAVTTSTSAPTGVALIVVDDASQNAIVIVPGSNGELRPSAIAEHDALLASADVVVCQMEVPSDTVLATLATARRLGKIVILNPAPVTGPLPDEWYEALDYLIPNELEAAALTGVPVDSPGGARVAAERLHERGAANVLITLGAQGVFALAAGAHGATDVTHYPAPRVSALDTTAAGDTFVGALAAALAGGRALPDAVRFAQSAAALSVTRAGAQPSIPGWRELTAH